MVTQLVMQPLSKYWCCLSSSHVSNTHHRSSSDAQFLIMLARARAPAVPIPLPTKLSDKTYFTTDVILQAQTQAECYNSDVFHTILSLPNVAIMTAKNKP